jgi:hypothetical protein
MFEDIKKAQLIEKVRIMAASGLTGDEIRKSLDDSELELMKSVNDIQKGKVAQVGEVRVWQGKKFRKQPNGKWVEISDKGMSKKDHEDYIEMEKFSRSGSGGKESGKTNENIKRHQEISSRLSGKEYDDSELEEVEHSPLTEEEIQMKEFDEHHKPGGEYEKQYNKDQKSIQERMNEKQPPKLINLEGASWEVLERGKTESRIRAVTESIKGKIKVIDNKIIDKKYGGNTPQHDKSSTKQKVKDYLIKVGNNPDDVSKMVDKHFDYAYEKYDSIKSISEAIRTIY